MAAHSHYNDVIPDMTCLGKIIGGGNAGRSVWRKKRKSCGTSRRKAESTKQALYPGNPLAMAAGIAALKALAEPGVYDQLESRASHLAGGLQDATERQGIDAFHSRVGSMLMLFFSNAEVTNADGARTSDTERYSRYFGELLERGVYAAPSQFEAGFVSLAHSEADIDTTVRAANESVIGAVTEKAVILIAPHYP